MKKLMTMSICTMLLLASCVSKKEYLALEEKQKETQDLLNTATVKLNACLSDAATPTRSASKQSLFRLHF